ncbi:MAG: hypothetical protein ACK5Z0_02625 [Planctomycetota bacterium]|jgi:hypothetical protein
MLLWEMGFRLHQKNKYCLNLNFKAESFMDAQSAHQLIKENINKHGFHIYLINGPFLPRYIYTVGLSLKTGFELVFAGGYYFTNQEAAVIVDTLAKKTLANANAKPTLENLPQFGDFSLAQVHQSWVNNFLNAIPDYFNGREVPCLQITPEQSRSTIDIPRMAVPFSATEQPLWQWMEKQWPYNTSGDAIAVTDLRALKGEKIKEAMRWEENQWELFASPGDQLNQDEVRIVPLAVLLGFDHSLEIVTSLEVGKGYWRDEKDMIWNRWNW